MTRRLFISNSGGETSAYMTKRLLAEARAEYDEVVVGFANTGRENEQTLEFVRRCDEEFGFNTVWVEAVAHHGSRKGCSHRVVNFETASRNGEPFEEVIRKYGIPNVKYPHCTRELKLNPLRSYLSGIGWESGTFDKAIGIRADEPKRRDAQHVAKGIVYPLMDRWPTSKPNVNAYWARQPFRLELAGYQGNCKNCFKKSTSKLLAIADENPAAFDWTDRMETRYGGVNAPDKKRVFFRKNFSSADMLNLYFIMAGRLDEVADDSLTEPVGGCSTESCEVSF